MFTRVVSVPGRFGMRTITEKPAVASTEGDVGTTRRQFLAASGAAALASTAGCLGRIASATTNISVSPAGVVPGALASGGVEQLQSGLRSSTSRMYDVGGWRIKSNPATIKASGPLSTSLDIESWSVDAIQPAQDYNTVRSNKRRSTFGIIPDDVDEDDDEFDDLLDELYEYLDGEPVIGETMTISLPDAQIPRGPALVDEITPERIFQYMTTDQLCVERDDTLWCWGDNSFESVSADDNEVFAWSWGGSRAELLVPKDSGRTVVGRTLGGSAVVTVQNDPPESGRSRGSGAGKVSIQSTSGRGGGGAGGIVRITDFSISDGWGEETESDGVTVTPVIAAPALAFPEDAPMPIPAVVYVRRCKHEGEYIYTGGWVVDDGALHENSCTMLTFQGPNEFVSFTPGDVASADAQRVLGERLRRNVRRHPNGASLYSGAVDEDLLQSLPEAFREGEGLRDVVALVEETLQQNNGGRNPQTGKEIQIPLRDGSVGDDDVLYCIVTPCDGTIAHLVDADDTEKADSMEAFIRIAGPDE